MAIRDVAEAHIESSKFTKKKWGCIKTGIWGQQCVIRLAAIPRDTNGQRHFRTEDHAGLVWPRDVME